MSEVVDTPLNPPRRALWKTLALSGALLMSGVIIGVGLTLIGIRHRLDDFRSRPDLLSQRMVQRMSKDLQLTDKQTDEIKKIFASTREEADAMRQRNRAQAQAFFREFQNKVAQVLTPSQQKEWEVWFRQARERAFHNRPGGPQGDRDERKGERPGPDRGFGDRTQRNGDSSESIGPPPVGIPERAFATESQPNDDTPAEP